MKYYVLFGPPGAGKGTHAVAIAAKYNFKHISTGELLTVSRNLTDSSLTDSQGHSLRHRLLMQCLKSAAKGLPVWFQL